MSLLANNHLFDETFVENEVIVSLERDFVNALLGLDLKNLKLFFNFLIDYKKVLQFSVGRGEAKLKMQNNFFQHTIAINL
jgi:hypothetical protein